MNKIIIYADSDTSAPFRYRCSNFVETMQKSQKYQVELYVGENYLRAKEALSSASILVIERQSDKKGYARSLIREAKHLGIKVVYSADDLIFSLCYLPLLMRTTHSRNVFYWSAYVFGNFRLAQLADSFTTTNLFLAKKMEQIFKKPAHVIPNFLNNAQIKISEKISNKRNSNKCFTIGYFSGSPTHYNDFNMIKSELLHFLDLHEDACLHIVGNMHIDEDLKKYINAGQIKIIEKVDYKELQKLYSNVDINLAPLIINDFTNCKSELKYFETAIVGTPTIASPTYAFKNSIKDGETGFLCYPGQWYDCLEDLYNHPEKRQKVAKSAKEYCLKNYYGDKIRKKIEDVYDTIQKEN